MLGARDLDIAPAPGDASAWRSYRLAHGGRTYTALDTSPDREDLRRFVEIARRLHDLGLNVPKVLAQDPEQGFLLLSDLGDRHYLTRLDEQTVERLYGDALGALVVLQAGIYTDSAFLPDYDERRLRAELELFREWYLIRHLGLALSAEDHGVLDRSFDLLVGAMLEQPRVWVHRAFHSRNLVITEKHNPGVLGFQGAAIGPECYDLVSLLCDCYIAWPRERIEDWTMGYHDLARQSGIPVCEDEERFLRWFDPAGVQRHLMTAGLFARLHHRDARPDTLADIARTLAYVQEVAARRAELAALRGLLSRPETPRS